MENSRNPGALIGGAFLLGIGILSLLGEVFSASNFWGTFWPFIIIGIGLMFYVGMFAGGRSLSGLAVPGTIITVVGLVLFYQNLARHWESWAYAWTVILIAVGLGMYIMGWYGQDINQRNSGRGVMRVGMIMFVLFGGFFELIFTAGRSFGLRGAFFPAALVLLGIYIIVNQFRRNQPG